MAGKLRVLWLPSFQRKVRVGEVYSEDELREAGLNPKTMLSHGEAEYASPKAASRSKQAE